MRQILASPKFAFLSDILLWSLILSLLAGGIYFFGVFRPERTKQIIHLKFQDANELTPGAVVRFMGTEIGYVEALNLKDNYVDVVIKTRAHSIKIPSGSTFTILFTGIVGSKSIEITPPDRIRPKILGKPSYLVENPVRLKKAFQIQIDTSRALQKGAENFADFFGKRKPVEVLQDNMKAMEHLSGRGHLHMKNAQRSIHDKQRLITQTLTQMNHTVSDFSVSSAHAAAALKSKLASPDTFSAVKRYGLIFAEQEARLHRFENEHRLTRVSNQLLSWTNTIQRCNPQHFQSSVRKQTRTWDSHLSDLDQFAEGMLLFESDAILQLLQNGRNHIQTFNKQIPSI